MQDDGAGESRERVESRPVGRPGVDDDGLAELGSQRELGLEETKLRVVRRVVAVVVEPGLADGDRALVRRAASRSSSSRSRVGSSRVMRMDAEGGENTVSRIGELERRAAGVDRRPDGDHALDARGAGSFENRRGGIGAGVQMRMGVNHRRGRVVHPPQLLLDHLVRVELFEEELRLAQLLPGRERARLPPCRPARVVAGEDAVLRARRRRVRAKLGRAGDLAFIAQELVQPLRAERKERGEEDLEVVDAARERRTAPCQRGRGRS